MKYRPLILVIGAQHGDERLGPRLQRRLQKYGAQFANIDYICGNPRAYRANTRFIDTDLNRSYNPGTPLTYEEKRAQKILQFIRDKGYDYVLDVHTSTADVGRFFITTETDGAAGRIIAGTSFERVVVMPKHIVDCSLIGQIPQAISIEYDRELARHPAALEELVSLLDNLSEGTHIHALRDVYYVRDTIAAESNADLSHKNFTLTEQGYYPILFGEKTYTQHRGFAAYHKVSVVI
jgi:hypothetical protein